MSKPPAIVKVDLGPRAYSIKVAAGLIADISRQISDCDELQDCDHLVFITDQTVDRLYGEMIDACSQSASAKVDKLVVADGEPSKSVEIANSLWQQMIERGADRKTVVVALGGGVVGDLAGWIAATYMRGVRLLQIPTTLLAQVDSSVGGKVGVNLPQGKNLVGAFLQPKLVLIDPQVLSTLDDRNFNAGMAEVIKYSVILDAEFFFWLEQNTEQIYQRDSATLERLITQCCQFKADIVCEDELETSGRRAILNYGHTLGHAIEAISGYAEFLHGEAIAIGMQFAVELAHQLNRVDEALVARQQRLLQSFRLPTQLECNDLDQIIAAMHRDKKKMGNELSFVLPDRLGNVELVSGISSQQIRSALNKVVK